MKYLHANRTVKGVVTFSIKGTRTSLDDPTIGEALQPASIQDYVRTSSYKGSMFIAQFFLIDINKITSSLQTASDLTGEETANSTANGDKNGMQ